MSLCGCRTGLTAGTTKIVATATDIQGNSSEFSSQRTVTANVGLLKSDSVTRQSPNVLDVDGNGFLNEYDAVLLAGYIDSKSNFAEAQSNIQLRDTLTSMQMAKLVRKTFYWLSEESS